MTRLLIQTILKEYKLYNLQQWLAIQRIMLNEPHPTYTVGKTHSTVTLYSIYDFNTPIIPLPFQMGKTLNIMSYGRR